MEYQPVVKTEFQFRAAAAGVMKRLQKHGKNLTIATVVRDGQVRYLIVRQQPK